MARLYVLNPRRKRRKKSSAKKRKNPLFGRRRRRRSRARRRRNPIRMLARANPRRRRSGRRRRNPFGLGKLLPGGNLVNSLLQVVAGYFITKGADWRINKDWTWNMTTSNVAMREPLKDAAATATALAVGFIAKKLRLGGASNLVTVGGLLWAVNRAIVARGRANTSLQDGTFAKHMLTDYVMDDGSDVFESDLGYLGDDDLAMVDDDLGDYMTEDDLEALEV